LEERLRCDWISSQAFDSIVLRPFDFAIVNDRNAYARNVESIHFTKDGHLDGRLTFKDYGRKQTISNPSDVFPQRSRLMLLSPESRCSILERNTSEMRQIGIA
jgi:hypothetical protein